MNLSKREMVLIYVAVALGVALVGFFVVSLLSGYEGELAAEVVRKQALLEKVTRISEGLAKFQTKSSSSARRKPLIGYVEQLATRNGLKERIQLNLVPMDKSRGLEAVNVRLDNLSLDELVGFVYAVENSKPVLVIDQMEITNSFRAKDQLRLSIRVLAQH